MTSELDALLDACRAAPDDDAPRLVWADAVGGERGEFVVLQCRLAREELSPAETGVLLARHDELLAAHGRAWSGFGDESGARRYVFRRGFVEAAELNVVKYDLATIFRRMPLLRSLHYCGATRSVEYHESGIPEGPDPAPYFAWFLERPELKRLRGLEVDDIYLHESDGDTEWDFTITSYGDEACAALAASKALTGFRTFAMREQFSPKGFSALLKSSALATVENLALQWGDMDASQLLDLFAATPNLRALQSDRRVRDVADRIPTSVVELHVRGVEAEDIAAVAASPVAATLERLKIEASPAKTDALFAAFPRLRALDLAYASTTPAALAVSPALRELRVHVGNAEILQIAEALGPQLALLDILGQDEITCVPELRAKVAGHVRAGKYQTYETPMVVGVNTREPWIRYGLVVGEF